MCSSIRWTSRRSRRLWRLRGAVLISRGCGRLGVCWRSRSSSYLAGDVAWTVYELAGSKPYPSVADAFYLLFYPLMLVGAVALLRRAALLSPNDCGWAWISAVVAIGGSAVVIYVVLGPTVVQSGPDVLETAISIAYPVGDMVLLVGLGCGAAAPAGGLERARASVRGGGTAVLRDRGPRLRLHHAALELSGRRSGRFAVDGLDRAVRGCGRGPILVPNRRPTSVDRAAATSGQLGAVHRGCARFRTADRRPSRPQPRDRCRAARNARLGPPVPGAEGPAADPRAAQLPVAARRPDRPAQPSAGDRPGRADAGRARRSRQAGGCPVRRYRRLQARQRQPRSRDRRRAAPRRLLAPVGCRARG